MTEALTQTVDASVIVLSVPGYCKCSVSRQIALRKRLDEKVGEAIADLAPADRLVVDTSDGAAILILGGPDQALNAVRTLAKQLATSAPTEQQSFAASVGVTFGPVRLAQDNGTVGVTGDGIVVAEAISGFSEAGQVLASRSFCEAAVATSPGSAPLFKPLGTRVDASVRTHEVFLLDMRASEPKAIALAWSAPIGRRTITIALAAAGLVVATGFGVRGLVQRRPVRQPELEVGVLPAPPPTPLPAPAAPSEVKIVVTPWAEISVDGIYKGKSPPLQAMSMDAGRHVIEFKHPAHKPYSIEVDVTQGEDLVVHYAFPEPRKRTHAYANPITRLRNKLGL